DLGRRYHVEQVFKPYPGGKPTHAPTDAALTLARRHDLDVDDIEEVLLRLSPPATAVHYAKPYVVGDYPTMNALWSYYFTVASALVRKRSVNESFMPESILDPHVQALVRKVKLGHLDKPAGVELEVRMKDGRRLSEYVAVASGEPSNAMSRDQLAAKFMHQLRFSGLVGEKAAEELVALVDELEQVDDVRVIAKLAAGKQTASWEQE
ncbi:MAG: MmgE/PrpD family protein, partial [Chloroflexota bacterium]|nr:MmgE/PrpD family protein [Chloroflexota bacterium]